MTSKLEDEDYWNSSDSKAFSFDEEELSYKSNLFDSGRGSASKSHHDSSSSKTSIITSTIFEGIPLTNKKETIQRPLGALISKNSLSKIFGEQTPNKRMSPEEEINILRRQIESQWIPAKISKTVKLIMLGQPYSLHLYRSLDLKTQLLDEAIKSGDGNAILAVVLFLSKTLKKSLFYQIMQKRPVAVSQYVHYLSTRFNIHELIDLLEMLRQNRDAAIKQFKFSVQGSQSLDRKLQKLKLCYSNHFTLPEASDKQFVTSFLLYLEWLVAVEPISPGVPTKSVLASLSHLCKNHWNDSKTSITSPAILTTQQGIVERQYQWTVLTTRASLQAWTDIETIFITKGWLGGKKLKSVISIERIAAELHKNGVPNSVLSQFLEVIDNLDKRLEWAKKLSCYKVVIDVLVLMKDRAGILEYMVNLTPEDYAYAETALRSGVKWKN